MIKENVSVILKVTLVHAKIKIPDLQRQNHLNLNLMKNVEDYVVFLNWKVLVCLNFSEVSYKEEMRKSIFQRNYK